MKRIDLRRVDLNLLVVFEVLMTERHVTRAADRLARTQSSVSHALARLREQLGDPLLVRTASGMLPSPFALALVDEVRPLLATAERILQPPVPFDAARATRTFRVAMPDFAHGAFTALVAALRTEAPGAAVAWLAPNAATLLAVVEGQVDVALVPAALKRPEGLGVQPVGELRWGCFGRAGHPAFRRWSRKAWSAWPHVQVGVGDRLASPVGEAARAARLVRRIAVEVPHFFAVAPLLASSDLLATLPVVVLRPALERYGLREMSPPLPLEPLAHAVVWSERLNRDAANLWFRRRLAEHLERWLAPA